MSVISTSLEIFSACLVINCLFFSSLEVVLKQTSHEPDAPNSTPRITGLLHLVTGILEFSKIIRRPGGGCDGTFSARFYYIYPYIDEGYGLCLHTYNGDGNPLPTFDKDPYLVYLKGGMDEIAATYWALLDKNNRVGFSR